VNLFVRLDYDSWITSNQNPVKMLGVVPQERIEQMASDDSYLAAFDDVYAKFRKYMDGDRWYTGKSDNVIAYFSMEYGLDISLPIYSGGLGVLSGDHMKTASDLGLPLIGVGLLYTQGYFRQYLGIDGFQQEMYPDYDWFTMPVRLVLDAKGAPVKVFVQFTDALVGVQVWEAKVGRSSVFLLDSNIWENTPENRTITSTLYGGGREKRIKQEIILGIAGIRALSAMGIKAHVTHMNEGHSAFLAIERIRMLMEDERLSFQEALQFIWNTNIFTTHTPVPAGNENFSIELMERYVKPLVEKIKIPWNDFLALGLDDQGNGNQQFCLTVLALRLSAYNNGVSKLHGKISRHMWQNIWENLPSDEIPISYITNGVHPKTWLSPQMNDLLDKYFGPRFTDEPMYLDIWDRISRVSDEELWRSHERRREELVAYARERLVNQLSGKGRSKADISLAEEVLSPYNLTISFARRFATYKRANLLLRDRDRLIRLLSDNERPIQIIFAGKAHPEDIPGKEIIKEIVHFASDPKVRSKVLFLEDYDFNLARYLISGSDIWLNTPRRPLEASGTSGIKAAINGVLNVSVLDGWWDEAYSPDVGWAIGRGEEYQDEDFHDEVEGEALYDLLEREIIPLFYARGRDGLPREWIRRMKMCMKNIGKQFSSYRMLTEYSEKFYMPAIANYDRFSAEHCANTKLLAAYMEKLKVNWKNLEIKSVVTPVNSSPTASEKIGVEASVFLAELAPEDIACELYYGHLSSEGDIRDAKKVEMTCAARKAKNADYKAEIECSTTGRHGFSIRIIPKHQLLAHQYIPKYITWLEK
jgi:starch phosphorylase